MKAAVQVLKQAEELKHKVSGDVVNDNEAWTHHQKLQELYQQLLVMDLEYALDKKVEQDLWNHVFKNQINLLQNQTKDKKNPRRSECQGNLAWFLEAASGFYLQLLQELCDAFELDLPCRRKGSVYGIIKGSKSNHYKITPPHKSSCLYVCQHCLVHLGDIARYRNQSLQAETFYRHAAQLVPSNGQPYNQLAILEAAKGEKLSTVFYYVRSVAVKHPFPVASTNLQKMFSKIAADELYIEGKAKLSVYDYINTFLQFHSVIHMASDLDRASKLLRVLSANLSTLVATESLSSWKMIQMTAINLFAVAHATRTLDSSGSHVVPSGVEEDEALGQDELQVRGLMLELLASTLNGLLLLVYTMKDETSLRDYYALPVVKLILDWTRQDPDVLQLQPFTNKLQIWPSLCKLLNGIQQEMGNGFDGNKYEDVPLPEDWDMQSFLPLAKMHKTYKFKETMPRLTDEEEIRLRAHRLVGHGQWLCKQEVSGKKLMTFETANGCDRALHFEAIIQEAPSSDVLMQLEEVSVNRPSRLGGRGSNGHSHGHGHGHVNGVGGGSSGSSTSSTSSTSGGSMRSQSESIVGPIAAGLHRSPDEEEEVEEEDRDDGSAANVSTHLSDERGRKEKVLSRAAAKDRGSKMATMGKPQLRCQASSEETRSCALQQERKDNGRPTGLYGNRERKARQNVAMQTIMQKNNISSKSEEMDDLSPMQQASLSKPKIEAKQVTFKTPSPSPPASSEGGATPPQTLTPQPSLHNCSDLLASFPPLQPMYSQSQQQKPAVSYVPMQVDGSSGAGPPHFAAPGRMGMTFPSLSHSQQTPNADQINTSGQNYQSSNRVVYSNFAVAPMAPGGFSGQHRGFNSNPNSNNSQPLEYTPSNQTYGSQMKEAMTLQQVAGYGAGSNRMAASLHATLVPAYVFGFGQTNATASQTGGQQQLSPIQQQQKPRGFGFSDGSSVYGQQISAPWFHQTSQPPPPLPLPSANQGLKSNTNLDQLLGSLHNRPVPEQTSPQLKVSRTNGQYQIFAPPQTQPQQQQQPDRLLFQMQHLAPQQTGTLAYAFQSNVPPPRLSQPPPSMLAAENHLSQQPATFAKIAASTPGSDPEASAGGEVITNTYSLFSSRWSSGLNLSPNTAKEGVSLGTNLTPQNGPNYGNLVQPNLQSLWSGPGPSPLERLLQQQKQKRETAPQ